MEFVSGNIGWIEVICGPMFSGKSEELIRRLRRAMIARKRVQVFKPIIDTRYALDEIVSHGDLRMKSEVVNTGSEILDRVDWRSEVIGVDEANFMGESLVDVVQRLADSGKQVIVAGLDTDYLGRPFVPIPDLLALAESITKTLAICVRCGNPGKHTQRLRGAEDLIVVGASDMYEARCRRAGSRSDRQSEDNGEPNVSFHLVSWPPSISQGANHSHLYPRELHKLSRERKNSVKKRGSAKTIAQPIRTETNTRCPQTGPPQPRKDPLRHASPLAAAAESYKPCRSAADGAVPRIAENRPHTR
jgi:thymidine kinase